MDKAAEKILDDLARGFDAVFGGSTRICLKCGMKVPTDPMKHFHDDPLPYSREHDELTRESGQYAREEAERRKP